MLLLLHDVALLAAIADECGIAMFCSDLRAINGAGRFHKSHDCCFGNEEEYDEFCGDAEEVNDEEEEEVEEVVDGVGDDQKYSVGTFRYTFSAE